MSTKEIYEIGEMPPIGQVPKQMYAQLIRAERFGEPKHGVQGREGRRCPRSSRTRCWSTSWPPASTTTTSGRRSARRSTSSRRAQKANFDPSDFHIGGSDASGIVYAVGSDVKNVKVGDEVVIHCGTWDARLPGREGRRRSDVRPVVQDLGLRDQLGQLRAVHQGAGAPVHAEGEAPDLGRGRGADAGRRDRLPHAHGLAAAHRARRTTSC